MTIQHKVADFVRQHGMFAPADRVVVGVSGGADSVALLRILSFLPGLGLSLVAAHVNHGLRGEAGDRDERFVRQVAAELGVPCEVERADVAAVARRGGLSLEEAGREVRYAFFRQVREKYGAHRIAVAHTADDQAETVLMRLLRGAGPAGAAGMEPVTAEGIVRPLLSCCRGEVEELLRSLGQQWCEDETNRDPMFLRNRVRLEVLPLLEQINPRIRDALCRFGRLAADDEACLADLAQGHFDKLAVTEPGSARLQISAMQGLPRSLRYRVIRRALREVRGDLRRVTLQHIEAVDDLLAGPRPNASVNLPGVRAVRAYDLLIVTNELREAWEEGIPVPGPGEYPLPDGSFLVVTTGDGGELSSDERHAITVDGDAAPFPWVVRSFSPGDRFYIAGIGGHKKLKKLFMEERIPREERPLVPLVTAGREVLWVCGVRRSDLARPRSTRDSVVNVTYKKSKEGLQSD